MRVSLVTSLLFTMACASAPRPTEPAPTSERPAPTVAAPPAVAAPASTPPPRETHIDTRGEHLALAQLHRWYQLYERPITPERMKLQLEILDPAVKVQSSRGTAQGHDAYRAGVAQLPPKDGNAHHVKSATVSHRGDGVLALAAVITYQRRTPDGKLTASELRYTTELKERPGQLPVFTSIEIAPEGPSTATAFEDSYAENRATSFLHYWLYLMEDLEGDDQRFAELLSRDGFELHFTSAAGKPLTQLAELATWHQNVRKLVMSSSHRVENLKVTKRDDQHYTLSVDFVWRGMNMNNALIGGTTHHEWELEDGGERFVRLRSAKVTVVSPIKPI